MGGGSQPARPGRPPVGAEGLGLGVGARACLPVCLPLARQGSRLCAPLPPQQIERIHSLLAVALVRTAAGQCWAQNRSQQCSFLRLGFPSSLEKGSPRGEAARP